MYAAKASGRGCYRYFTKSMQLEFDHRVRLSNDLRNALSANELSVYFQPIIDLSTRRIYKAEALMRWKNPEFGCVGPDVFIPIAENNGTIHEIGNWAFINATKQAKRMQSLLGCNFQMTVNKSPIQFKGNEDLSHSWIILLKNIKLTNHNIVIEVTEGIIMDVLGEVREKLLAFHDAGFQIAIDDFGTGYSSLSYLKKLNVDYLKIDQSFMSNLCENSVDYAICEAIVVMAQKRNIKVIAEGVEKTQQRDLLVKIGCDYAQGFLFSKPLPSNDFESLVLANNSNL
jgi:EAL domain-containing protein (putative c-di-GMP-specific phosphodiesterase class I)